MGSLVGNVMLANFPQSVDAAIFTGFSSKWYVALQASDMNCIEQKLMVCEGSMLFQALLSLQAFCLPMLSTHLSMAALALAISWPRIQPV